MCTVPPPPIINEKRTERDYGSGLPGCGVTEWLVCRVITVYWDTDTTINRVKVTGFNVAITAPMEADETIGAQTEFEVSHAALNSFRQALMGHWH